MTSPRRRIADGVAVPRRRNLAADLLAGVVVAIMLVPQAMAYSMLAGLPPAIGLYAAMAGALIYPLLGSSRYLAVGPVAIVSLLVASGIASLAPSSAAEYLAYAVQLALLVAALQLLLGLLRLGFLVNYLSHAVVAGFTTAAALVIGFSQVKLMIGVTVPRTENFVGLLRALTRSLPEADTSTVSLALGSVAVLLFFSHGLGPLLERSRLASRWIVPLTKSAPLVVVGFGTALVAGFGLDGEAGVRVVGQIPAGLPSVRLSPPALATWSALLPTGLAITFVGFAESYAVAKTLASKRREKIRANRELIALGAANLAASFAGGYPVTGGFSRSVVNFAAGARSGMASLVSGLGLILTLAFLTPLFHSLPHAVLAAIIVVAVAKLVDFKALVRLWHYSRADGVAYVATFAAVLLVNVETGILVGASVALALHLWRTSRPHYAVVGRVGTSEHYRNILRHDVQTEPAVLALRIDESLYFANTAFLEDRILTLIADRPEVRHLVLIMSAVNFIDGSALETLEHLVETLREAQVTFHLAEVKGPVMDRLHGVGFADKLEPGRVFLTTHEAMQSLTPEPEAIFVMGEPVDASTS